jgi:hypothetical protein
MAKKIVLPQQKAAPKKMTKTEFKKPEPKKPKWSFPLDRQNFIILGIGLGIILLGYALMATGITEEPAVPNGKWNNIFAVFIAPFLLVIGYCAVIPYGLYKLFKN